MIDSIILLYGYLLGRTRLLSPIRYTIRVIGNFFIPRILMKEKVSNARWGRRYTDKKIIVSFTSFPGRIEGVWVVVKCLLRQTVLPDKIILWLSKDQFGENPLPKSLTNLLGDIFEIRMVENDYRSHKKYFYSFKEYKDDIVILVDDDIYYNSTMIEDLLKEHLRHPNTIICRYGSEITYNEDGSMPPFNDWWVEKMSVSDSSNFFLGTGGGSLFQPKMLIDTVTDIELATELTPFADDIWINAMIRLSNLSVYKIKCGLLLQMSNQQRIALKKKNSYDGQNDVQFKNVIEYFMKEKGINPFKKR